MSRIIANFNDGNKRAAVIFANHYLISQAGGTANAFGNHRQRAGDAFALSVFNYTGTLLGRSFADFVAFSAPEAIVLFGGLARAKEFLYEPMLNAMNENLLKIWKGKVQILFSQLKESDAAILGASALAW